MKRLAAALALFTFAPAAHAGGLAEWIVAEAKRLDAPVSAALRTAAARPTLKPAGLDPKLTGDLERFGLEASRLSVEIDRKAGAVDLRCIFRGMAEETDAQLQAVAAASTGAQQAAALDKLDRMLADAALIGPAAQRLLAGDRTAGVPIDAPIGAYAKTCPPAER